MKKRLPLFLMTLLLSVGIAQSQSKFYVLNGGTFGQGANARAVSPNGKYVVGKSSVGGFIWNSEEGIPGYGNEIIPLNPNLPPPGNEGNMHGDARDVTDDGIVVGEFPDSTYTVDITVEENGIEKVITRNYILSGGVWENGKWTSLGLGPDREVPGKDEGGCGSFANSITNDGRIIGGYYKAKNNNLMPCSWTRQADNSWKIEKWASPPTTARGNLGSVIMSMSEDGQRACGWTNPDGQTIRKAIIWKSPNEYRIIFSGENYTGECFKISSNGKYATFMTRHNTLGNKFYVYDLDTDEITPIGSKGVIAICNDKTTIGGGLDGFMYFDDNIGGITGSFPNFIKTYAPDAEIPEDFFNVDTPMDMSDNSRFIAGYTWNGIMPNSAISWFFVMDQKPTTQYPRPLNAKASLTSEAERNKIVINWEAPKAADGSVLKAYEITRNGGSRPVATVESNVLTYTFTETSSGENQYAVRAVYEGESRDIKSNLSDATTINIIKSFDLPLSDNFNSRGFTQGAWTFAPKQSISANPGWCILSGFGMLNSPSASFVSTLQVAEPYSESMISRFIDPKGEKQLYLTFLYSIGESYLSNIPDTFNVEVLTDIENNQWKSVYRKIIKEGTGYSFQDIDLSGVVDGIFKIRFRVSGDGKSYFNIHIDNVSLSNNIPTVAESPKEILVSQVGNKISIGWQDPGGLYGITHMDGFIKSNEWAEYGRPFIAAIEFDPEDFEVYKDLYLTSITAYISNTLEDIPARMHLCVFEDGVQIVDQEIKTDAYTPKSWNTFKLDKPVSLNTNKSIRFGIDVKAYNPNDFIVGMDVGPARQGKGNLVYINEKWTTLSGDVQLKHDKNWSIVGNISEIGSTAERKTNIIGYEIFRNNQQLDNGMYANQVFTDYILPHEEKVCYKVRAYYDTDQISLLSEEACIDLNANNIESEQGDKGLTLYPNPAKEYIYINGDFDRVVIYDLSGKVVLSATESPVYIGNLDEGVYIVTVYTEQNAVSSKMVIKK